LGINTTKTPQSLSKEEIDQVKIGLRNSKTGVTTELKLNEFTNLLQHVFTGSNLLSWLTKRMRYTNPKDAYDMYKFLQEKKVFKEFYASSKPVEDPNKPLSFEDLIAQVSTTLYCFYEDDFDVYLKTIPADQLKYVVSLIIGPLGVRVTNSTEPILTSKLVGWMMKRFSDIKNRTEAARFVLFLAHKGYLKQEAEDSYVLSIATQLQTHEMPLEICGICKHFTMVLSFQPKVTLACGHTFHRHCLAELPSYEMGRCSSCDAEVSTSTAMSELDLVLPFINKILASPNPCYTFRQQIATFTINFDKKFCLQGRPDQNPQSTLQNALKELTEFIYHLMEQVLDDIRLLQQHENGVATCLRTIKKFVLPKIYQTLFPLYLACNKESDLALATSLEAIRKNNVSMSQFGVSPKFTLLDKDSARRQSNTSNPAITNSPNPSRLRQKAKSSNPSEEEETNEVQEGPYRTALLEFERVRDYVDVYDKLNCIVVTRHLIADTIMAYWKAKTGTINVDDLSVTADDLVAILTYIVAYAEVPHIYSEFQLIQDFTDETLLNDEPGYCLVTIMTVLTYLMKVDISTLLQKIDSQASPREPK